jgi:hypothetical protein
MLPGEQFFLRNEESQFNPAEQTQHQRRFKHLRSKIYVRRPSDPKEQLESVTKVIHRYSTGDFADLGRSEDVPKQRRRRRRRRKVPEKVQQQTERKRVGGGYQNQADSSGARPGSPNVKQWICCDCGCQGGDVLSQGQNALPFMGPSMGLHSTTAYMCTACQHWQPKMELPIVPEPVVQPSRDIINPTPATVQEQGPPPDPSPSVQSSQPPAAPKPASSCPLALGGDDGPFLCFEAEPPPSVEPVIPAVDMPDTVAEHAVDPPPVGIPLLQQNECVDCNVNFELEKGRPPLAHRDGWTLGPIPVVPVKTCSTCKLQVRRCTQSYTHTTLMHSLFHTHLR